MATGHLYKRGDKWYFYISTGKKLPDGRYERLRYKCESETKQGAQGELDEKLYLLRRAGAGAHDNKFALSDAVEKWCEHINRTVLNPKTANEYVVHGRRIAAAIKSEFIHEIRLPAIENAMKEIASEFSTNTANKCLDKLKAILNYAIDNHWIVSNPARSAKHLKLIREKFRRDLSHEEVEALLKRATKSYRLLWYTYVCTGARREELLGLRVEDVDLKKHQIRIRPSSEQGLKTNSATRTIPINKELAASLAAEMPKDGFVFATKDGNRRKNNMIREFRRHMEAALKDLGWKPKAIKPELKRLDIHSLRYTFITEMIDRGVNPKTVQQLAGHKSVQTTMAIYAQCRPSSVNSAVESLPWSLKSVATNLPQTDTKSL